MAGSAIRPRAGAVLWRLGALSIAAIFICSAALGFAAPTVRADGPAPVAATGLRVDGASDPLGIDDTSPSLGWRLEAPGRGVLQSAYEIQVADDEAELLAGDELWDSGRVESAESVSVPYGGPALAAERGYAWRVRVWDGEGEPSDWSSPASWEMGPLESADWHGAEWIGPHGATDAAEWTDYRVDVDFTIAAGAAGVVFRERDPDDYYMWQVVLEGEEAFLRPHLLSEGQWHLLGEVPLGSAMPAASLHEAHHLRIEADGPTITTWIDGQQVDSREDFAIPDGGVGFRSGSASEDARFDHLEVHDREGAQLFADQFSTSPDPAFPEGEIQGGALRVRNGAAPLISSTPSVPLLRRGFTLSEPLSQVATARVYACGLGLYSMSLSGARVGDRELTPPATDYADRVRYQTYDVGSLLRDGANALGIELAEGYGPAFSRFGERWLGPRQALAMLDVTYRDGTHQRVVTDGSWRWGEGPVRQASIYGGETYDARLEQDGWDEPGFANHGWEPVRVVAAPGGVLEADTLPPIRAVRTIEPVAVTEPRGGAYVFDLGENVSGWARLRVHGPAGTTVRMRYAEDLAPDGEIDRTTNRNAAATDTFVLAGGGGPETFEPQFTYHGFRYVEVTGLPSPPTSSTLEGRVVHADMPVTAEFESSDPLLDRIYEDNRRTMANNAMSYPTDNPVRDERTGPGMDVQAYGDAAVRDFDADRFFAAYLRDQPGGWGGSPDMNAYNVPLAWSLYEQYGDRATLESAYPAMKSAVDRYQAEAEGDVWTESGLSGGEGYGDWCPPPPEAEAAGGLGGPEAGGYDACFSEVSLVDTALAYRDATIVAAAARALGHPADATRYEEVAATIESAFEARFAVPGGYGSRRQVTSVLPIAFGMVPPARRAEVDAGLVERVLDHDSGHLDTGIFGTRFLVDALVDAGRPDVAMTVLDQTTYPGFGYQIGFGPQIGLPPGHGATTAWEQWVYRSSMESHDHAMFAGVNASLIADIAGIEPLSPGYARIGIAPVAPSGLERAGATLQTVRGEVGSHWRREGDGFHLDVVVPPNAVAEVRVPTEPGEAVTESGEPAASRPGVASLREEAGAEVFEVGSGSYAFLAAPEGPAGEEEPEGEEEPGGGGSGDEGGQHEGDGQGGSGPTLPPPGPQPREAPPSTVRLRARARALGPRRISLTLSCLEACPSSPSRLLVTVSPRARGRDRLGRAPVTLSGRRTRFAMPVAALVGRLRVLVTGIDEEPEILTTYLRRWRWFPRRPLDQGRAVGPASLDS